MDLQKWRGSVLVLTFFISISAFENSAHSEFQFGLPTNIPASGYSKQLASGDFNNDGNIDIAAISGSDSTVVLLFGDGDGAFNTSTNHAVASPREIAAGDFNDDENLDLITVSMGDHPLNSFTILLGDGAGGFAITNFPFATNDFSTPNAVEVADINGDGRLDFAVCGYGVQIYAGDGNGLFTFVTNHTIGNLSYALAFGKFNADNKPDIVTANYSSSSMSVLLNDGSGGFLSPTNYSGDFSEYHYAVLARDFNGDGRTDIVTMNYYNQSISIRLGVGNGTFGEEKRFPSMIAASSLACADFDGDGFLDLVTAAPFSNPNFIGFLPGNGDGTFGTLITNFSASGTQSILVADFNKDGSPDIAAAHDDHISIRLNEVKPMLKFEALKWIGTTNLVFTNPVPTHFQTLNNVIRPVFGNFDSNGSIDIAFATPEGFAVKLNDGNGSWGAASNFPAPDRPILITAGDLNNDQIDDIVIFSSTVTNAVLLAIGNGEFAPANLFNGSQPNPKKAIIGDFNNDGANDLVLCYGVSSNYLFVGNGGGSFELPSNIFIHAAINLASGHFNSDTNLDIISIDPGNNLRLHLGNGDGTFVTDGTNYPGNNFFGVADFNQDGNLDIGSRKILWGDGQGNFSTNNIEFLQPSLAMGDLNGDKIPDVLAYGNSFHAFLGRGDGTFITQTNVYFQTIPDFAPFLAVADFDSDGLDDIFSHPGSGPVFRRYLNRSAPAKPAPLAFGDRFKLQWPAWDGLVLESSAHLYATTDWIVETNVFKIGELNVHTNRAEDAQQFYRLRTQTQ